MYLNQLEFKDLMAEIQSIKNRFGIIGNSPALNYALQVAMQVSQHDLKCFNSW